MYEPALLIPCFSKLTCIKLFYFSIILVLISLLNGQDEWLIIFSFTFVNLFKTYKDS